MRKNERFCHKGIKSWKIGFRLVVGGLLLMLFSAWGFFAHRKINRLAVFTLPPEMAVFYKRNINFLEQAAVNPDRRRYSDPQEGPRHYIDMDSYGDSANYLPLYWEEAVKKFGEDSLMHRGIVPWHISRMYYRLRDAFMVGDPDRILTVSAELGHYVADAHVPLHTSSNHDGQKSGQIGIHGFWESRLPELFSSDYDFFVGRATHIDSVQNSAWKVVYASAAAVDSVLSFEKELSAQFGDLRQSFENRGRITVKVFSVPYSKEYHRMLAGMVERRMRNSIHWVGSIWYTAWVDAGQPDLARFLTYRPTEQELQQRRKELDTWKATRIKARPHEEEEVTPIGNE